MYKNTIKGFVSLWKETISSFSRNEELYNLSPLHRTWIKFLNYLSLRWNISVLIKFSFTCIIFLYSTHSYSQNCSASFIMTGSGTQCGTGIFTVIDFIGTTKVIGNASSGFMETANSSEFQEAKDIGALPSGRYRVVLEDASTNSFRLHPLPGTNMHDRNGMLIHGYLEGQSRQEASRGCIILDRNQRDSLRMYFNECGELELTVTYN